MSDELCWSIFITKWASMANCAISIKLKNFRAEEKFIPSYHLLIINVLMQHYQGNDYHQLFLPQHCFWKFSDISCGFLSLHPQKHQSMAVCISAKLLKREEILLFWFYQFTLWVSCSKSDWRTESFRTEVKYRYIFLSDLLCNNNGGIYLIS